MTREEAINYFKRNFAIGEGDGEKYHNEVLEYTIKALEQEPILDKIKAEIEPKRKMYLEMNDIDWLNGCDYVLSVIDKYKAESEEKE